MYDLPEAKTAYHIVPQASVVFGVEERGLAVPMDLQEGTGSILIRGPGLHE